MPNLSSARAASIDIAMDEFLRFFLTGKRSNLYRRFCRIGAAVSLLGSVTVVVPVLFTLAGYENLPLSVVLYALGTLFSVIGTVLERIRMPVARSLMEIQHSADELEATGDERRLRGAVYGAWRSCGKGARTGIVAAVLRVLGYLVLAGAGIAVACGAWSSEFLFLACIASGVLAGGSAVLDSVTEGRAVAALYRLAEGEIGALKRAQGESDQRISREAETAKGFSSVPRTVELFLKEAGEREDFRKFSGRSSLYACLSGAVLGVLVVLLAATAAEQWGETAMWSVVGAVAVIVITAMLVLIVPLQRNLRFVYARNAAKLGENQTDALRLRLQRAWIFQQRVGNLIFLTAIVLAVVAGLVIGLLSRVFDPTAEIVSVLGGSICVFLVYGCVLAMIVWIIFYAVQRHKLRPIESELSALLNGAERE